MTESIVQAVVIVAYKTVWFVGQAIIFWFLWNVALAQPLGLVTLGFVESIALYALLRLVMDPPKLRISIDDR
jgi:hypothetical protein